MKQYRISCGLTDHVYIQITDYDTTQHDHSSVTAWINQHMSIIPPINKYTMRVYQIQDGEQVWSVLCGLSILLRWELIAKISVAYKSDTKNIVQHTFFILSKNKFI